MKPDAGYEEDRGMPSCARYAPYPGLRVEKHPESGSVWGADRRVSFLGKSGHTLCGPARYSILDVAICQSQHPTQEGTTYPRFQSAWMEDGEVHQLPKAVRETQTPRIPGGVIARKTRKKPARTG